MVQIFNDDNFNQMVIEVSKQRPVLVDFFAPWCGPCQMMGPIIDEAAEVLGDKAAVGKLNIDEAPKTAEEYDIMSVPTIVLFKNGKAEKILTGLQDKTALLKLFE